MPPGAKDGCRSCPSAQPEMKGAVVLGVRESSDAGSQIAYLNRVHPVTEELIARSGPLHPTEVMRFAAPCEEQACRHFDGTDCRLATRIVQILPAVVDTLPACTIRTTCRWFQQEGRAACFRCPQIITQTDNPSPDLRQAATPE